LTTYIEGSLLLEVKNRVEAELRDDLAGLKPEEAAVLTLLQARLLAHSHGRRRGTAV
jgi:DNA topoisomerase-1